MFHYQATGGNAVQLAKYRSLSGVLAQFNAIFLPNAYKHFGQTFGGLVFGIKALWDRLHVLAHARSLRLRDLCFMNYLKANMIGTISLLMSFLFSASLIGRVQELKLHE
jgi:hypothetical protein